MREVWLLGHGTFDEAYEERCGGVEEAFSRVDMGNLYQNQKLHSMTV
jgi:hypothetical protein